MSAKSTTKNEKRTIRDYSDYAEAADLAARLEARFHAAGKAIREKHAEMACASERQQERAVALLDDPDSPMPQSDELKLREMQADQDATGKAVGEARRRMQAAREASSHDEWDQHAKPEHDALMRRLVAACQELQAAVDAETEFIRELNERGFLASSKTPIAVRQSVGSIAYSARQIAALYPTKGQA